MLPGLSSEDEIKAQMLFFPSTAIDRFTFKSGVRESNPPPRLGKPMHYRCANTAKSTAKVLLFLHLCKSLRDFLVNFYDFAPYASRQLMLFKRFHTFCLKVCHPLSSLNIQRDLGLLAAYDKGI